MKVLNFGSLNIDYTYQVDHFVRAGETMSSESLQVFSGARRAQTYGTPELSEPGMEISSSSR